MTTQQTTAILKKAGYVAKIQTARQKRGWYQVSKVNKNVSCVFACDYDVKELMNVFITEGKRVMFDECPSLDWFFVL